MEHVAVGIQVLKNFDVPVRCTVRKPHHVNDQEVLSKPMHPGWLGNVAFELPLCVDVEDEAAARRQMPADPGKQSLPVGEAPNVIYGVEYAANHVKPVVDVKIDHILPEKFCLRHFMARNREHSAGSI
jgi:hypothetical protein